MLAFSKYHGLGNDFLLVYDQEITADLARRLCDRHFGVGADGVIVIAPSERADFSFLLYNADGGEAEVSGNGLRCVGKFLYDKGLHGSPVMRIEAAGEVKTLELQVAEGVVEGVRADMGVPVEEGEIELFDRLWRKVRTGNPHAVTFVDDIESAPVTELGPLVENHPTFPDRTNVEFVRRDGGSIDVRFWERGVGVTLASGTGSCAAVVAAGMPGARVRTLGGELTVERDRAGRVFMTGPATHVFDATLSAEMEVAP
jgi:diaminopimelate epimerase